MFENDPELHAALDKVMEEQASALDLMARYDRHELTVAETMRLAATILYRLLDQSNQFPYSPVFVMLLIDLFTEEAEAAEDHAGDSEYCRSEQHAYAVARSIVYPPASYDTEESAMAEYERVYDEYAVPAYEAPDIEGSSDNV